MENNKVIINILLLIFFTYNLYNKYEYIYIKID